jgi:hypothetical protein
MRFLRRWWWAILIALVLIVRAVLPEVVRRQLETRASEALHATVKVGNVDLALLTGGVALDDVTVRALDAPPEEAPLVGWKRFAVDLRWLPLFHKTIELATVELVEPQVALDRLQSGDLNLMALVPKSEAPAAPATEAAAAPQPSGWKFGIDYLGLERGGVRFRDLLMPGAEPVTLSLQLIEIRDIALEPEVYGGPADIKFVVRLDEGSLRTRARFTPRPNGGMALDLTLDGTRLPVHRSRVYVPGVAWSDLTGLLSIGLRYRLETGGRNEVSGRIGLDDLTVWVAGIDEPALTWKSLGVDLEKIDLAKHDARVKRVTLDGAVVPARPRGPDYLPVMTAAKAAAAAAKSTSPEPGEKSAEEPAPPWSWSVGDVRLVGTHAHLLSDQPMLDVGVELDAKTLSGPKHEASPVKLGLAIGDGKLGVDGTLRIAPLGFAGSVTSAGLDVPKLVDVVGVLPKNLLQVAKLDADLKIALGSAAPTPGDVTVSGTTAVSDLWVAAYDPKEFATGAKKIAVGIDGVTVPGVMAAGGAGRAMTIGLGSIDVNALYARVTRGDTGIVLPAFTTTPAPAATPAAPPPAKPATAPAGGAGPAPQVTIGNVALAGRVDLTDRTVKPFYWGAFDPLEVSLQQVHVPDLQIGAMKIHAVSATKGTIDVTGAYLKKSDVQLVVKDLALMPFNPYVTGISPYSISRGALFVTTKASIDGPAYDTTTWLTLSDFDIASRSGKNVVLEQLGIPLTVAIALLRDWKGNIDLTVPVKMDEKGTSVALGTVVTGALVSALVGTLTSPLKVLGAVLPRGGSGEQSLAPVPIHFPPGSSTLDGTGEEQVKQLAAFLAGRPALGVTLGAPVTQADLRARREQGLLAKLGPRSGMLGRLRNLGARGRIVDALDARAHGEEGKLDDDDAKALEEYLADIPPPSPEAVKQLGEARIAVVEKTLHESYGIGAGQIAKATTGTTEPTDGDPGVSVEMGTAGR